MEKQIKKWIARQQAFINMLALKKEEGVITASTIIKYWRNEILDLHKIFNKLQVDRLNHELKKNPTHITYQDDSHNDSLSL